MYVTAGNGTTHAETTVDAANTLTLVSGRDTTLEGAQARGETVIADIGRSLTMTSQQDTNDYARKDQSAGIDVAFGTGGGQVSASYNQSKIDSTYTSVKEQTGIQAGEGGFDIRVGGHTQLNGAAIASAADPLRNRLETGSLGWSDLENEAEYKASSFGISASGGSGGGSVSPNISVPQHEKSGSTTQAGIADGTLIVHDGSGEGIARGVTELQQDGLKEIFDQQKVAERMEMGQVAGQVGMRAAGDLAQQMGWEEGSKEKVILHGIVGAGIAALGGGDVLEGLAGAATNQLTSKAMQGYLRGNDIDPNSPEGKTLMELGSLALGAVVGGGSGAATALAAEQFNRQLHPDERHVIEKLMEEGYSEEQLMAVACVMVQCLLGRDMIEPGTLLEGVDGMSLTPAGTYLASQYQSVLDGMTAGQQEEITRVLAGSGLFKYTRADAYKDAFHDVQTAQRLGGVTQAGLGLLGAWASSVLCPFTVWGCAAAAESADNMSAGLTTWYQGRPALTLQNQAWQAVGLSPGNPNLVEALTGMGIAAGGAFAVNRTLAGQGKYAGAASDGAGSGRNTGRTETPDHLLPDNVNGDGLSPPSLKFTVVRPSSTP
nr:hemagglutinin repeat-containing protein [Stenotrophomonas mori]